MIQYSDGTVFNTAAQTMVNTINCLGVMGAGIALEFRLRYPEMYADYLNRCERKEVQTGRPYLYREYTRPWVLNFPTKHHWKYPSKLEWIEQGLGYFVANYERMEITSIAFPKLGTSRGKLDWKEVQPLMERYLQRINIPVHICLDTAQTASGIEGVMVDRINDLQNQEWISELQIKNNITDKIKEGLPIHRFYELSDIDGIGGKIYEKVFRFFYARAQLPTSAPTGGMTQLTLLM